MPPASVSPRAECLNGDPTLEPTQAGADCLTVPARP